MLPNDGQQESKFDAFQYYSSDLLRLKTLLLSSNHDDDELSVLARVNGINNSEPIKKQNEAVIQPQLSWDNGYVRNFFSMQCRLKTTFTNMFLQQAR